MDPLSGESNREPDQLWLRYLPSCVNHPVKEQDAELKSFAASKDEYMKLYNCVSVIKEQTDSFCQGRTVVFVYFWGGSIVRVKMRFAQSYCSLLSSVISNVLIASENHQPEFPCDDSGFFSAQSAK